MYFLKVWIYLHLKCFILQDGEKITVKYSLKRKWRIFLLRIKMKLYELMDPNWKCVQCDFGPVLPLINLLDALNFLISWNLYNKTCVWGPAHTRPAELLTPPRSLTCWYNLCLVLFPQINQSLEKHKLGNFLNSSMFDIYSFLTHRNQKYLLQQTFNLQ